VVCGQRRFPGLPGARESPTSSQWSAVLDDRQAFEIALAENARRSSLSVEDRQESLRRPAAMYPGRPREELETWLGAEGQPAARRC